MKLGILREGKFPPDKRVPFSPEQCKVLQQKFGVKVVVQRSPIRAFTDREYEDAGIEVSDSVDDCNVLLGVKEVPVEALIASKTYMFFSHTFKKQPYNKKLLQAILQKQIRLIDYELLTNAQGTRLVAFGRYAGIVGAFNALRGWGLLRQDYQLKPAHECKDKAEMEAELDLISFSSPVKIVITGTGRVAHGAREVLDRAGIKRVTPKAFLTESFSEAVYTDLSPLEYVRKIDGNASSRGDFYQFPEHYESDFLKYAQVADLYIACHYWANKAPFIFSRADARLQNFNIKLVADVSCDIDGPVACTLRPSAIDAPFYGYDPMAESEVPFGAEGSIGVMAVDNLPCELPRDASVDFGDALIQNVMPHFFNGDVEGVLVRATETENGKLTPQFAYLQDFVDG